MLDHLVLIIKNPPSAYLLTVTWFHLHSCALRALYSLSEFICEVLSVVILFALALAVPRSVSAAIASSDVPNIVVSPLQYCCLSRRLFGSAGLPAALFGPWQVRRRPSWLRFLSLISRRWSRCRRATRLADLRLIPQAFRSSMRAIPSSLGR